MRGKAMAFGIMLVVTAVCLLQLVTRDFGVWYLAGAGVGLVLSSVYGYGFWLQVQEGREAAQRSRGGRKPRF